MKNLNFKIFVLLLAIISLPYCTNAQETAKVNNNLSRSVYLDFLSTPSDLAVTETPKVSLENPNKKSRILAGALSAILPGAGEFYSEHYLKAAIFFLVEAAAVTTAIIYNHKGDFQTAFFEQYADKHWSAKRYAEWTLNHTSYINPEVDPSNYNVVNNDGSVNWGELNRLESDLGGGYTHRLPHQGEQQYYELIGKYPQYSHGWDQANPNDTDYHILSYEFNWYSHQRGVANDYYNTGAAAVVVVVVNHVLSVADAIWSTDLYNGELAMNMRVNGINVAGRTQFVPTMNFSLKF